MKQLPNQQLKPFASDRTEIEPEITRKEFLIRKEEIEQEILCRMKERFELQGDSSEEAQRRAIRALGRLSKTLKSPPENLAKLDDRYFSNYRKILAAFETNPREATLGKANEVFTNFKSAETEDILSIKDTGKELKDKINAASFNFYKGEEVDQVIYLENNAKRLNFINAGIVSVLPAYNDNEDIIGIITLDGQGDTAVSYFDGRKREAEILSRKN